MTGGAEPLFRREDDGIMVPTGHTRGPWDPGDMHGGAPAALLAQALEVPAAGAALARMTFEFLGPVPIAPVRVSTRVAKPGRNFRLLEGTMTGEDGRALVHVRAVALARGEVTGLPSAAALPPLDPPPAGPADGALHAAPAAETDGFLHTGMELRYLRGSIDEEGPALVWLRMARPLLDGEAPCPAARACAAADFGNGVSRVVGFDTHVFVNTDLTVTLLRPPTGDWVLMDATTRLDSSGVGFAASALYDAAGPLGQSQQTLFVRAR